MLQGMLKPMMMKGIMVVMCVRAKRSKGNRMFESRRSCVVEMLVGAIVVWYLVRLCDMSKSTTSARTSHGDQ
jgi:hypothetical protein